MGELTFPITRAHFARHTCGTFTFRLDRRSHQRGVWLHTPPYYRGECKHIVAASPADVCSLIFNSSTHELLNSWSHAVEFMEQICQARNAHAQTDVITAWPDIWLKCAARTTEGKGSPRLASRCLTLQSVQTSLLDHRVGLVYIKGILVYYEYSLILNTHTR
jgi:hypothetical protein